MWASLAISRRPIAAGPQPQPSASTIVSSALGEASSLVAPGLAAGEESPDPGTNGGEQQGTEAVCNSSLVNPVKRLISTGWKQYAGANGVGGPTRAYCHGSR